MSSASRSTFWPLTAKQVREARALEVVDRRRVDAIVLAEDEAAQKGCLGVRRPPLQGGLRPPAKLVDEAGEAAAATARERDRARIDDAPDAEARQVGGLEVARLANRAPGRDLAADREVGDRLGRDHEQAAVGGVDPHAHLAVRAAGDGLDEAADRDRAREPSRETHRRRSR